MTEYMLAQVQLHYGYANLERYNQVMPKVRELFEAEGAVLLHASVTRVGRLFEAWNLWQVEDQGHMARVFAGMGARASASDAVRRQAAEVTAELAAIVESEHVRFLESLPFSPT